MQFSAQKISDIIDGVVSGDPEILIHGPSKIEEAKKGTITFLGNPKYEEYLYTTEASAVIVNSAFKPSKKVKSTLIKVGNVYEALGVLLKYFNQDEFIEVGVSENAFIHQEAIVGEGAAISHFTTISKNSHIGANCKIYDQVYVGPNVSIGEGSVIYPGVRIMRGCKIGKNCIIHANAVIGSDGFGLAQSDGGGFSKVQQIGNVIIGDDVEIGANTTIDRATMGATIIENGVKLDNLIQVAHNSIIGAHTAIAAQTGISGSTEIGKFCMIGGQVGFAGHIKVADRTKIGGQSGISRAIKKENTSLYGTPAMDYQGYLKSYAHFKKLPDLSDRLRKLESIIEELQNKS
jgi:UDP-3-O-[3-hydroxymyristoyl] glucosamine N-acyltransferase